jgi:hypothetical protein
MMSRNVRKWSAQLVRAHFALLLSMAGCAIHSHPVPAYRLAASEGRSVLIPPGIRKPDAAQVTFKSTLAAAPKKCPPDSGVIEIQPKHNGIRITVDKDKLSKQPTGWLAHWAAELESDGCVAPGSGIKLAERIADAVPLDLNESFRLLHSPQLDIISDMRIQVVSPIVKQAAAAADPALASIESRSSGLAVALKSTSDLVGYETAFYAVQPNDGGPGVKVVALYADVHEGSKVERRPTPAINYFRFPPDAGFYRVFYETQRTDYAAVIVAARTTADLERRCRLLETSATSCEQLDTQLCVNVPKQVAINGLLPVIANGTESLVNWRTTVGGLVRMTGERSPNSVLPRLTILKQYEGKPVRVEFDQASPAILNLILTGGEIVSWK